MAQSDKCPRPHICSVASQYWPINEPCKIINIIALFENDGVFGRSIGRSRALGQEAVHLSKSDWWPEAGPKTRIAPPNLPGLFSAALYH
jgi:hypothetical protein